MMTKMHSSKGSLIFPFSANNFFGPLDRFKIEGSLDQVLASDYDHPFDAPAWPGTYSNQQFTNNNAGWSYSTEVHAFFEYRSDADMTFTFSGMAYVLPRKCILADECSFYLAFEDAIHV